VGEGRTNTYLAPLKIDIADSLGVNAMLINQADNGKLTLSNLRFWTDVAYTGIAIYAVEGGCRDRSGQAIFSGSIDNCWFDHNSTSAGVFRGGLNNYRVSNCTFEFMKGCFYRQGRGMGDVAFINNVMSNCYDAFYDGMTDTLGDNLVRIDGLHVYTHNRGQVIQTRSSSNLLVNNVMLQAAREPISGVGLFAFTSCENVICSNFNATRVTAFGGSGPLGVAITIDASKVKLSTGIIDGADCGVTLSGSGASVLTITDVDIVNSHRVAFTATGSPHGRVSVYNCNWSDSNADIIAFGGAAAFDLFVSNCRIANSGLGSSYARNINIATSGTVYFDQCLIGRDDPGAKGDFYIDAAGKGTITLRRPVLLGTPPQGMKTGIQKVSLIKDPEPATL
jgi:hypothetical protein